LKTNSCHIYGHSTTIPNGIQTHYVRLIKLLQLSYQLKCKDLKPHFSFLFFGVLYNILMEYHFSFLLITIYALLIVCYLYTYQQRIQNDLLQFIEWSLSLFIQNNKFHRGLYLWIDFGIQIEVNIYTLIFFNKIYLNVKW
jgi:hypothetical protein